MSMKAVQASTGLPRLYRPVRIAGCDYVDGGVKKTAHINLAIHRGADLVICLNPIVPILNMGPKAPLRGHLSNKGVSFVLDQVLRIILHGRMVYGLERYKAEHPEVDILLIEPTRDDMRMFGYNIIRMSARKVVAEDGYRSVVRGSVATSGTTSASSSATASACPTRRSCRSTPPAEKNTQLQLLPDKVETLYALADGRKSVQEVEDKVSLVFSDDNAAVTFSSIHKAKGLEAENVYVLRPDLLPHPMAKKAWEVQQEKNLQYVAYTRTLNKLTIVEGKG